MPIYVDPHQTNIAKGWKTQPIRDQLKKMEIMGDLHKVEGYPIYGVYEGVEVPPFIHPLTYVTRDNENTVVLDLRSYVNSKDPTAISVNNRSEYNLQINRALLTHTWINLPRNYFANVLDTTMKLFIKWVSSQVGKRFSLNVQDILIMEVVLGAYYINLFNDEVEIDDMARLNMVNRLTKVLRLQPDFIEGIIGDDTSPIESVQALCMAIKFKTQSVRLKDLDAPVLYTIISKSWFGHNAPEMLAVALEHIPTFYALIYTASTENLYRKTGFSQAVEFVLAKDKQNTAQGIKNLMDLSQT